MTTPLLGGPQHPLAADLPPLDALAAVVLGPVYAGQDVRAVEETATYNLAVQHRPAVVVGATCAEDVAAAVSWAVAQGMPVAAQATGHGPVSPVEGGMLISTSRLDTVQIDPERRVAVVGAGVRWAQVNAAAAPHGLAGVSGSSSQVGVVGYSLGGGLGSLGREFGFGADHVRSIEIVTAEGRIRHVDAGTDPDLFWALRGAKSNFGVVTSMEIGLVPVTSLYAGAIFFTAESTRNVLHAFRSWSQTLPEQTSTSVALLNMPPLDDLPEPLRGRYVVMLRFAHHGSETEGAALLEPMRRAGDVLIDGVGPLPYTQADLIHQDPTDPMPIWEKGALFRELTTEAIEGLLDTAGPESNAALVMVEVRLMGGALGRPAPVPNAVAGREGAYTLFTLGVAPPGVDTGAAAAGEAVHDRLRPWLTGTCLLNWLGDASTPAEVAAAWQPDVHGRLMSIKRAVDPDNVFRYGHALGV